MRVLLASNNAKKRAEIERILGSSVTAVVPADLGLTLEPEETGATFEQNSALKALAFAAATDLPVLADDSGLEVDALGGQPGVHSARFAGAGASDAANRGRLLAELAGVPAERRTARFTCVLTLARRGEVLAQVRGECAGRILARERGTSGFGYDPLFLHEPSGLTFAELAAAEKDAISHRGVALRRLAAALNSIGTQH